MGPTKKFWQRLLINYFKQLLFVAAPDDGYFLLGFFVDKGLCNGPDHAEQHRRIYYKHLPQGLRVIILSHRGCQLHKPIHSRGGHAYAASLHVDYYAGLLDEMASSL